jgi:hypothetical protein
MKIIGHIGRIIYSMKRNQRSKAADRGRKPRAKKEKVPCLHCRLAEARLRAQGVLTRAWCYIHALKKFRIAAVEW